MRVVVLGGLLLAAAAASAQSDWYFSWGYNRSAYTTSDVHIQGDGPAGPFDLTFAAAEAYDMPERFQAKVYFHPALFTIPQFDVRLGRTLRGPWRVSIGWDHMKYKLSDQTLSASGHATAGDLAVAGYEGAIDLSTETSVALSDAPLFWGEGFNFEHSDGVNFVRAALEFEPLLYRRSENSPFSLHGIAMVSAGLVVCSTDFTFAGERTKNPQHVSGFGGSTHLGLRFGAGQHLFLQGTLQAGALHLPWISLQGPDSSASADQSFGFSEAAFALGYRWGLHNGRTS